VDEKGFVSLINFLIHGYQRSASLFAAVKLDLFTRIEVEKEEDFTYGESALADCLVKMGLLTSTPDGYEVPEFSHKYFSKSSKHYIGDYILHHGENLYRLWGLLSEAVPYRHPVLGRPHDIQLEHYLIGLGQVAPKSFPFINDVGQPKNILDIGGGCGWATLLFRLYFPEAEIDLIEQEDVCWITRKYLLKALGDLSHISIIRGRYPEVVYVNYGYDLIFISEVLHGRNRSEAEEILHTAFTRINPGGYIIVREYLAPTLFWHLFNLNMMLCTKEGRPFEYAELKSLLEDIGFRDVRRIPDPSDLLGREYVMARR